jgi:hypothetical protein
MCGCGGMVYNCGEKNTGRYDKELDFNMEYPVWYWATIKGHPIPKYCACGCGQLLSEDPNADQFRSFCAGHEPPHTCKCGCGMRVKQGNKYAVNGHQVRMRQAKLNISKGLRKAYIEDPMKNKRKLAGLKKTMADPKVKKRIKEKSSEPDVKIRHRSSLIAAQARPEVKKKRSEGIKAAWKNPNSKYHDAEIKAKKSTKIKALWADPGSIYNNPKWRAKLRARRKAVMAKPEVRAKISSALKAAWADPNSMFNDPKYRAKFKANQKVVMAKPEVRAKISSTLKKAWANPNSIFNDPKWRDKRAKRSRKNKKEK